MRLEYIVLAIVVLFGAAFAITSSTGDHEWSGTDDQAVGVVKELTDGSYQPWYSSIWEPPGKETESLLFALQAAFGAIIIGYFLGYYRGLAKGRCAARSEEQEK